MVDVLAAATVIVITVVAVVVVLLVVLYGRPSNLVTVAREVLAVWY